MPRFEPFPGIRYADSVDLGVVTSPPYDVIDAAERQALAGSHPANAVHVDCPVGDLGSGREGATTSGRGGAAPSGREGATTSGRGGAAPSGQGGASSGDDVYEVAARTFDGWRADGTLVTDERPSFTLYRMSFVDEAGRQRATTGVLGALTLERPGEGDVLPHERTTPKAKSDRLDLLRATKANLSAIWGLSLAGGLSKLLDPPGDPLGDFTDPDGVRHQSWRIDDPAACRAISEAVAAEPIVIADGHHRYETSLAYRDEAPAEAVGAASTLCLVVELVDDQLTVQPIHRLLSGLPEGFDLLAAFGDAYEVTPAGSVAYGELGLVTPAGSFRLTPRSPGGALDTVVLDEALASFPEHTLSFQHGVANVAEAVASGRAQAGVLLRPVGVPEIAAVADARDRMPPKTTFFWPKPRTGVVFRSLLDG